MADPERRPGLQPSRTVLTGVASRRAVKPQVEEGAKTVDELIGGVPESSGTDLAIMKTPAA